MLAFELSFEITFEFSFEVPFEVIEQPSDANSTTLALNSIVDGYRREHASMNIYFFGWLTHQPLSSFCF